jgi:tetratricopeptide (TPR) repeat protein
MSVSKFIFRLLNMVDGVCLRQVMLSRLAIWLFLAPSLAWADAISEQLTLAGIKEFTAAYQAWDGAGFARASNLFDQACQRAPESGTNCYWKGVAKFHLLLQLLGEPQSSTNQTEAAIVINATIEALTRAVKLNDRDAESHALLGTVYGMSIAMSPARALWLGPRVSKHQKKALQHGPENPRVQYLIGMSHYHAGAFGGGKKAALECLLKAEKLFAAEAEKTAGPLEPRWGRSSSLAFIGKAYDALGKPADAEKYYRKALALNPQDRL